MIDNNYIAKKIKLERERLGLTQVEFGVAVGFSKQSVSSWEKGRNLPDIIALDKIARLGGKTLSEFFDDKIVIAKKSKTSTKDFTDKEEQIINKFRAMNADKRKAFEVILGVKNK